MAIQIFIDDTDRTDYIALHTLKIEDELYAKINTCSFVINDEAGSFVPEMSSVVEVYDPSSNLIFAGLIVQAEEVRAALAIDGSGEILKYNVRCDDWTKLLQKKLVVDTFENKTCKEIIDELISSYISTESVTTTNVAEGPTIAEISFNYKPLDKAIDELAKAAGYDWYIDYNKDIHFFAISSLESSMTITDNTTNWFDLKICPDISQLRNRVYIRGGIYYSDLFTQSIEADGIQEEFTLAYTPKYENFAISISSVERTIGILHVDEEDNYDFMLNRDEKTLSMGNSAWAQANTPLAADAVLVVSYSYEIPILVVTEDTNSIEALAALEGGDGVYEYVIVDDTISSISAARERSQAELREWANAVVIGSVSSYDAAGLTSGDLITINSTRRNINANYLIQKISISWAHHNQLKYTINFSGKLYNLVDVLISLFRQEEGISINADEILDALLRISDATSGAEDSTPILTESAPPFKWSNDEGTTENKMQWNLFQWS